LEALFKKGANFVKEGNIFILGQRKKVRKKDICALPVVILTYLSNQTIIISHFKKRNDIKTKI